MKKVLVIGGSGFLGSHVADKLSDNGYQVSIFDIEKSTYLRADQKMIIGSISDNKLLDSSINGMDIVYHFAGIADIKESTSDPILTMNINVMCTMHIIDLCVKYSIDRFMYASTIYVYSNHGSFYKTSKQCSELIIENYVKSFNISATIMRFGSLYGARANHFNSIRKMITQAINGGRITRTGDGEEVRDYIHVSDAAETSVKLLGSKEDIEYVMITGNQTYKIKDIVSMINEMMNNKLEIMYTKESLTEHYHITPYNFKPNIAKKYNIEYTHDLGQGILESIYNIYEEIKLNDDYKPEDQ
jgi:UDP-glucose 4-epimerase